MNPCSPILIKPQRFTDERGWFMESWSEAIMLHHGIRVEFVQDNHSMSLRPGTIRGIHFQRPPHAQAKLVRCTSGAIVDYAVDLRRNSPTFGRWVSAELTARNGLQLYVPVGFGHAFITLTEGAEVNYKVSEAYAPAYDDGIVWNDAMIGIDWPLPVSGAMLSDKDKSLPTLAEFDSPFEYDGHPLAALALL